MIDFVTPDFEELKTKLHEGLVHVIPGIKESDIRVKKGREGVEIRFGSHDPIVMQALSRTLGQATGSSTNYSNSKIVIYNSPEAVESANWHFFNVMCMTAIKTEVVPGIEKAKDKGDAAETARKAIFTGVKHLFPGLKPEQIYFTHTIHDDFRQQDPGITHINITCEPDLTLTQKSKLATAFKAADDPSKTNFGHSNMFNQFIFGGTIEELAALNWKKFQAEAQKIKSAKGAGMGGVG